MIYIYYIYTLVAPPASEMLGVIAGRQRLDQEKKRCLNWQGECAVGEVSDVSEVSGV